MAMTTEKHTSIWSWSDDKRNNQNIVDSYTL
jgi:hypothetical protein